MIRTTAHSQSDPRRRRGVHALLGGVVAVLAVVVPSAPALAAQGEDTVTWSVAPATDGAADDRISLRHTIDPGGRAEDAIAVTNQGRQDATFVVAPGDGVLGDNGAFDIASDDPTAAGSWVSLEGSQGAGGRTTITVPAGETRHVPLDISVPDAATPGDHPAGIVVALAAVSDQVTVTHRIGVRLHLRVAGDVAPALAADSVSANFTPSWIPFAPGTLRVTADVTNTGNARLAPAISLSGTGAFGLLPVQAAASADELLPGGTTTLTAESEAWPLAFLMGSVQLSGSAVGEDQVSSPPVVTESVVIPAVSWTGLALVLLCATGVVVYVRRRHRRRAPTGVVSPRTTTAATVSL